MARFRLLSVPVRIAILLAIVLIVLAPARADAGMPSLTLSDVPRVLRLSTLTRLRLEAISFFLVVLLACAWGIQAIWNSLRKDFTILPRLSYGKALGVMVLWGLLFVLVLTMISGARELMTPGAWKKEGLTYRLADDSSRAVEQQITERHETISRLRDALVAYARAHGRNFPPRDAIWAIPEALWKAPVSSGERYVYVGGKLPNEESPWPLVPVAYEPDSVGPDRLVILSDGEIIWLPITEIERQRAEKP